VCVIVICRAKLGTSVKLPASHSYCYEAFLVMCLGRYAHKHTGEIDTVSNTTQHIIGDDVKGSLYSIEVSAVNAPIARIHALPKFRKHATA